MRRSPCAVSSIAPEPLPCRGSEKLRCRRVYRLFGACHPAYPRRRLRLPCFNMDSPRSKGRTIEMIGPSVLGEPSCSLPSRNWSSNRRHLEPATRLCTSRHGLESPDAQSSLGLSCNLHLPRAWWRLLSCHPSPLLFLYLSDCRFLRLGEHNPTIQSCGRCLPWLQEVRQPP